MIKFKKMTNVVLLAGLGFTGTTQASLFNRGGGMIYDDQTNLTWAADANLFKTQAANNPNLVNEIIPASIDLSSTSFDIISGKMTWYGANAWSHHLTLGGFNDWTLPTAALIPIGGGGLYFETSQMGDLFRNELGLTSGSVTISHNTNYNLFSNIQNNSLYFANNYGVSYFYDPNTIWLISDNGGAISGNYKGGMFYAWAVRSGDVAAVPVPGAVWLFGSGLIGLASFTRRKNKTTNLIAA